MLTFAEPVVAYFKLLGSIDIWVIPKEFDNNNATVGH